MTSYRVTIDLDECIGYGRCCELAPRHFRMDGKLATLLTGETDDPAVLDAAGECPMSAITVVSSEAA